ncbi:MAG: DUF6044 family protein [Rhizobiaceae bacterium]
MHAATMIEKIDAAAQRLVNALGGRKDTGLAVKLLILGLLLLQIEFVILGPFSFYLEQDAGNLDVPALMAMAHHFPNDGHFYDYGNAGVDKLSNGYFGWFNQVLFYLLPGWIALTLLVVSLAAIAGWFTLLLCRDLIGAPPIFSAVCGLIAAFSFGDGHLYFASMALMPSMLWCLDRIDNGSTWRHWILLFLVTILHSGTGHMAFLLLVPGPVLLGWLVIVRRSTRLESWLAFAIIFFLPICIRIESLLAGFANAPMSHRHDQIRDLMTPGEAIASLLQVLLQPLALLSVLGFFVLLLARFRHRETGLSLAWRLLLLAFLLVIGPIVLGLLKPFVITVFPELAGVKLDRAFAGYQLLLIFCVAAVVVVIGQSKFETGFLANSILVIPLALLVVAAADRKLVHAERYIKRGSFVHAFHSEVLSGLSARIASEGLWRAEPIRVHPNRLQSYKIETLGGYFTMYPKRYQQFWLLLSRPMKDASPVEFESFRSWGNDLSLSPNVHKSKFSVNEYVNENLLSFANVRYLVSKNIIDNDNYKLISGPDKPWDSFGNIEKAKRNLEANFTSFERYYVYENKNAFPRFFIPRRIRVFDNTQQLLTELGTTNARSLRHSLIAMSGQVSQTITDSLNAGEREELIGSVIGAVSGEDQYDLQVKLNSAAVVASSVGYSPFWTAELVAPNGKRIAVRTLPVYHAFLGVEVPVSWTGRIELRYNPPYSWQNLKNRIFGTDS